MRIGVALHQKNLTLASRKYGTFCVPRRPKPGLGTQAPEIRDVPGNTGRLATLVTVRGTLQNDVIATPDFCTSVRAVAQNSPPIHSN